MLFRFLFAFLLLAPAVHAMEMDEDMSQPLEWHFGGDVNYGKLFGTNGAPSTTNAFSLGKIDTMLHGRLARAFSVLAEIVYEGEESFGFDIERVMLNYEPRTWLRFSIGRFHTPVGYWNTAYHHARWMYVSTEAPLLVRFEDEAGPLQAHTIGLLVHGSVPAGSLKLEYDFSVGNGRGPTSDPPQNFSDVNEGKSLCGALHLEIGGLRFGFSGMIDSTILASGEGLDEQIGAADLHLRLGDLEAIAEGAIIHHSVAGITATNFGGYAQASYGLREDLHLYGRAERFVRDANEGYLHTPTTSNILGGIRFDMIPSAAIKVEGGWQKTSEVETVSPRIEGVTLRGQVAWLF